MQKRAVDLDQLGDLGQRLGAELARFAFQRMRGKDQRGRVLLAHGALDLGDRLHPILLEIAEDADEARAKLRPALLEMHPIDDIRTLVAHCSLPAPDGSGVVPPSLD